VLLVGLLHHQEEVADEGDDREEEPAQRPPPLHVRDNTIDGIGRRLLKAEKKGVLEVR
jgi:hypothetical protein